MKLPMRTNVDQSHCKLKILNVQNRRYLLLMQYMYYKSRYTYIEEIAPERVITRQLDKIIFTPDTPTTEKLPMLVQSIGKT